MVQKSGLLIVFVKFHFNLKKKRKKKAGFSTQDLQVKSAGQIFVSILFYYIYCKYSSVQSTHTYWVKLFLWYSQTCFCLIFLLIDSDGEPHQFPSKPLRESQSRLLSNGQTWTESDETEEQDREGGIGG